MATNLHVIQGDITKIEADIIVNAANTSLLGGGGVDGAIHRAGGPEILEACRKIRARQGGCKTGEAVITTAGRLTVQYVIHTVGPVWQAEKAASKHELLAKCYHNSLDLARQHEGRRIAFPNISTGIYRFPKKKAAQIAIETTQAYIMLHPDAFEEIIFVCYDVQNFSIYRKLIAPA